MGMRDSLPGISAQRVRAFESGGNFSLGRVRSDKTLFPFENGAQIDNTYFRGVDDWSTGDGRNNGYMGIMSEGFALASTVAWGEDASFTPQGELEGNQPHYEGPDGREYVDPYESPSVEEDDDDFPGNMHPRDFDNGCYRLLCGLGYDEFGADRTDQLKLGNVALPDGISDEMMEISSCYLLDGFNGLVEMFHYEKDAKGGTMVRALIIDFSRRLREMLAKKFNGGTKFVPTIDLVSTNALREGLESSTGWMWKRLATAMFGEKLFSILYK